MCIRDRLNSWIKKYSNLAEELSLPSEQESPDMSNRSKEAYKDANALLKKRIKALEKALSFSKLETEARELMITRAEELDVYKRQVQNRVSKATGQLPAEVTQVGVTTSKRQTSILQMFSLYSPDDSYDCLLYTSGIPNWTRRRLFWAVAQAA